jgi:DNA-directed RNA polymerase subunit N
MIPVTCFSCGKPVGQYYEVFKARVKKGENPAKVLDALGLKKYCCRRMILSQADFIDEVMAYPKP